MIEIIHKYTREDALADGVLIDVTEMAKEAGFKVPVAVTSGVWGAYISQDDINGRLWDTLFMLHFAIKKSVATNMLFYKVRYGNKLIRLKAVIGPGDNLEPVMTIMLPEED